MAGSGVIHLRGNSTRTLIRGNMWLSVTVFMDCCPFPNCGAYHLGSWLIIILGRDIIGLAVIMAGTALLLAFYAIMLWWRTKWQSSRAVAVPLLVAVSLLCAYELCVVYVTAGSSALERYSCSGFFFGVSAIGFAINMLFICRMFFNEETTRHGILLISQGLKVVSLQS